MAFRQFGKSFHYAWRGIRTVIAEEQNFRIQLFATVAVLVFGAVLHIRTVEMAILVLVSGSILVLELLNSLIERVVDLVKPRLHPYVAEIKNIAAGAVLVAAGMAILVALFIFLPYLH
jgi:diacylglycerol kinase